MHTVDHTELDRATREALKNYRVPPAVPLDSMWTATEQAHFGSESTMPVEAASVRPRRSAPMWFAAAATLVLGIGIGRYTVVSRAPDTAAPQASVQTLPKDTVKTAAPAKVEAHLDVPYEVATNRYLGEAAALLAVLPMEARAEQMNEGFQSQAKDLLLTTRLLLDSPAAKDPSMEGLLSDLELVLAQVVRLQSDRDQEQLLLLTEAMRQREVIPRLENAVIRVSKDF